MSFERPHTSASWRLRLVGLALIVIAIVFVALGIFSRINHENSLQKKTLLQDISPVEVINPNYGPSQQSLTLPGNVAAYTEAPIYARVSGYLKAWYTDIGTHVKAGQLLAIIETPELDQQIHRADDMGLDKIGGAMDGTVDMRFRGEIDDSRGFVVRQYIAQ